ncbi:response regulator [Streptomonospora halotolerans]|nr:response regulator [Streptomonospora nanhaiensis]
MVTTTMSIVMGGVVFAMQRHLAGSIILMAVIAAVLVSPVVTAAVVRQNRDRAEDARVRAEQTARLAELDRRNAVATERTRMARELHDSVATRLSIIVLQSTALLARRPRRRDPAPPAHHHPRGQHPGPGRAARHDRRAARRARRGTGGRAPAHGRHPRPGREPGRGGHPARRGRAPAAARGRGAGRLPDRAGVGDQRAQAQRRPRPRARHLPGGRDRADDREPDDRQRGVAAAQRQPGPDGHARARRGAGRQLRRRPGPRHRRLAGARRAPGQGGHGGGAVIRVVIADDQVAVRTGLSLILDGAPDIDVVAEAGDGNEAVALARDLRPDVLVMDIRMPRKDGITATRELAGVTDVLIMTTFDLDEYVFGALHAGAAGFLLKSADSDALLQAVRTVARGEGMISPWVTRRLIRSFAERAPARQEAHRLDSLTRREREVLRCIGEGLSNYEISERLEMADATAKTHVSRILSKLGLRSRVQAAILAQEHEHEL